jgi:hypothetical protein
MGYRLTSPWFQRDNSNWEVRSLKDRGSGVTILVAAALLALPLSVMPAAAAEVSTRDVEEAMSFREELGFRHDQEFVLGTSPS